jgi:glycosyltransferase involved in cell wall biosynthesis
MLDGFLAFSREHPEALLLLKTSTPHRGVEPLCRLLYEEQLHLASELFPPLVSERVWLTDQVLTRDGMNHLFDASSFYLCTSYGEGQNLPLLEAMGRGVVPISVDHTAMADYIRPDNAVVITSELGMFDRRLTSRYGMYGAMTHYCRGADVEAAIRAAMALDAGQYCARSEAALETVRQQYGAQSLGAAMQDVIARITAQRLEG